ncbi:MAG: 5'/3'-nucleotidase SurE, partial [Planctomycetia bacterium]|nr:5'/3'-nucleotidase SurE [Planctomycetia bacterium]
EAPGLAAMGEALADLGELAVVAPTASKSGAGHSITLRRPILCRKISRDGEVIAYGIEGTPADCVKVAVMSLLPRRPDMVASGINSGYNAGINVLYSGTVAAAVEGAMLGIPSLAVSAERDETDLAGAAAVARRVIEQVLDAGLAELADGEAMLLNVNIPHLADGPPRGIRICRQSLKGFVEIMDHKGTSDEGHALYQLRGAVGHADDEAESDIHALEAGYVTITPLKFDLTHDTLLERLSDWDPKL